MERNEWRVQLDVDGTRGVVEVSLMAEAGVTWQRTGGPLSAGVWSQGKYEPDSIWDLGRVRQKRGPWEDGGAGH